MIPNACAATQFKERLEYMLESGAVHPKMGKLQDILVAHFRALRDAAEDECGVLSSSL